MSFGRTLQKIRRSKGMAQRTVAIAIDMDHGYFSRLENDRFDYKPSRETVEKIAKALNCNEEEHAELLAEANRLDKEMETLMMSSRNRPEIKQLFRAVINLPREKIEEIINQAEKEVASQKKDE